jgi:hypothetical protein
MKICDLLEIITPEITKANYSGELKQSHNSLNDPNSGAFSVVKPNKKDPHTVNKFHHGPLSSVPDDNGDIVSDGYTLFALWLAKNKIYNVCLPRIYKIRKIVDSNGKYIYSYNIEKLHNATDIKTDELLDILSNYFSKNEIDYIKKNSFNNKDIIRYVGKICERYIKGQKTSIINNELIDGLDIISKFVSEYNSKVFIDLENSGNIMFRLTQYGYQLVITDPVA